MEIRTYAALHVEEFPRASADRKHPLWWGILGLIAVEMTVVMTFVASYFYLRMGPPDWPVGVREPLPLLWESVDLGLLLASAGAMWWASRKLSQGSTRGLVAGVFTAVALDSLVLLFRWLQLREFLAMELRWSDSAYASIVWTITGFHFTHVASAVAGSVVVGVLGVRGFWNPERQLGVVADTMYWYFVSFAWIPLYLTLYWTERVLG